MATSVGVWMNRWSYEGTRMILLALSGRRV
jgi:hypothetical protein